MEQMAEDISDQSSPKTGAQNQKKGKKIASKNKISA
jgi:hypothetical protein